MKAIDPLKPPTSLKIVQDVGWYLPDSTGGTEVYVAELVRLLRGGGHDVVVAAPDPSSSNERTYQYDGAHVYRYPIPSRPSREEVQGQTATRGTELFHRWLQRQAADVVHFHTFVTGLGLHEVRAAAAAGSRVIVTTHASSLGFLCQRGTLMRWGRERCDGLVEVRKCAACELQHRGLPRPLAALAATLPVPISGWSRRLPGKLGSGLSLPWLIAHNRRRQRELFDHVHRFVVLTGAARQILSANGAAPDKLALNRLGIGGVDPGGRHVDAAPPARTPIRIGFVGRFESIKGAEQLALAVESLPRSLPIEVEFRASARTNAEQRVKQAVQARVTGDARVRFAEAVSHAALFPVLRGYDVLCCPSLCYEGGPTVALEAHSVGTPVVGYRIGGLAELIEDGVNGRLVEPGDWRQLARVIHDVAENPSGTIDRWRRALPAVRTMAQVAADYLELYRAA